MQNYAELENQISAWAAAQPAIRAVVVVGSRARLAQPADQWSDLDLMLFTNAAEKYVDDTTWLALFGEVWVREFQRTRAGDPEWMVVYAGGLKVDFFFAPMTGELSELLFNGRYAEVARRGVRVLLDKDSQRPLHPPPASSTQQTKPSAAEFTAVSQTFHLYAYRTAMMLLRGDLWRAQTFINNEMRPALMQMLAWQAQATHGLSHGTWAYDTWYDGRFLETWADPRASTAIAATFPTYDFVAMRQALLALLDLFGWLMHATAVRWQFNISTRGIKQLAAWVTAVLA